ncbi:MAG TPA: YfhO family protein [Chthonomonadaceae bacterium]|nr:YfhO family protein [Chthonomonadaceae bacterium]
MQPIASGPPVIEAPDSARPLVEPALGTLIPFRPVPSALTRQFGPYVALLLFAAALLWPLCLGRSLYWGDILLYFHVMLGFASESLRQGRLPLWNPYVLCGQPYVGNPQSALFYPTTALLPLVPVWLFLSLNTIVHLFLCGTFAYLFLRRWTHRRAAALSGALVYMGSASLVGRIQFPPMIQTAPYFPLLLACVDACVERPGPWTGAATAIVVGLTLFAAHAQMAYLIFAGAVLYAGARLLAAYRRQAAEPGSTSPVPAALWLLASGGLGLLLASAHLLPALQLAHESVRERMTVAEANRFVLELRQLLTLIAPRFFGHPASGDYWGGGNAWEPALFVGWLPLLLIGYVAARCIRQRWVRFWIVVALGSLWLALGRDGGLFTLAFWVVPGLSEFHDPARFLFVTTLAFAALTAAGLDAWLAQVRRRSSLVGLTALALIAAPLWWYGQDWNPATPPAALASRPAAASALRPQMGFGRLYLPGQDLFWKRYITEGYRDYGPADPRFVAEETATLMPNLPMRFGLEMASGYEPVPIDAAVSVEGLARAAYRRGEPNLSRLMALLNATTLALPRSLRVADPRLLPPSASQPLRNLRAWRNLDATPRAWIVRRTRHVEGRQRILAALAAPDFDPREVAIVSAGTDRSVNELGWGSDIPPAPPIQITARAAGVLHLHANAGAAPGFLVVAATAYPGWKATVDGRPARLLRADGALMGLLLPPGTHQVRLVYAPDGLRLGLYLTLLACGALTAIAGAALRLRPSPPVPLSHAVGEGSQS